MYDVRTAPTRFGIGRVLVGVLSLLTLRFWASPIASRVLGRDSVSVVAFLGIPFFLLLIGAGIVLFVWGPEFVSE